MSAEQKIIGRTRIAGPVEKSPWFGRGGLGFCPGCETGIFGAFFSEVMDEMELRGKAINVQGVSCAASGTAMVYCDRVGGAHGPAADYAVAIKRVHPDAFVYTTQGDSDCISIGISATIYAASRSEKINDLMFNNGCTGNTGGQMNTITPLGAVTPTTPWGRDAERDGLPIQTAELLASLKGVAYSARGAVNTPAHRQKCKQYVKTAFEKQLKNVGFSFVEILIGCPTNRRLTPVETSDWVEKVQIPQFPLGEFKNVDKIDLGQ